MERNEDQTEIIPIELPLEVWGKLALQAHEKHMMLNDYIIEVVLKEVLNTPGMLLEPAEWLERLGDDTVTLSADAMRSAVQVTREQFYDMSVPVKND